MKSSKTFVLVKRLSVGSIKGVFEFVPDAVCMPWLFIRKKGFILCFLKNMVTFLLKPLECLVFLANCARVQKKRALSLWESL